LEPFDLLNVPLSGRNLIEANAGTGKTYAISGLFLRLVVERGLPVNEILVMTYTVAATEELKDRIRGMLRKALDALRRGPVDDPFLSLAAPVGEPEVTGIDERLEARRAHIVMPINPVETDERIEFLDRRHPPVRVAARPVGGSALGGVGPGYGRSSILDPHEPGDGVGYRAVTVVDIGGSVAWVLRILAVERLALGRGGYLPLVVV